MKFFLYVIALSYLILMYLRNSTKYLIISIFFKILNYTFYYLCHDLNISINNIDVLNLIVIKIFYVDYIDFTSTCRIILTLKIMLSIEFIIFAHRYRRKRLFSYLH